MKTLFDKINPSVLKAIYDDQSNYPHLVEGIVERLKSNVATTDLSLNDCWHIFTYCYGHSEAFSIGKFFKIFEDEK